MDQQGWDPSPDDPSGPDPHEPRDWPGEPADPDVRRWPPRWLLRLGRGVKPSDDLWASLAEAHGIITRYKGPNGGQGCVHPVSTEGVAFTRGVVRDALVGAPDPIQKAWVRSSLGIVASLAGAVEADGKPLTREYAFDPHTRTRFLHKQRADLSKGAQRSYRSRLDVIARALNGEPVRTGASVAIQFNQPNAPYTRAEEAALLSWIAAIGADKRRARTLGVVGLCLGCGGRRTEIRHVRGTDVTRDADGVHVRFTKPDPRTVTCLAAYEDLLWEAATNAGDNLVAAPWTDTLNLTALTKAVNDVNGDGPPVVLAMTWLRTTWMVRHLAAGTPLAVLVPAAALSGSQSLDKLLQYVDPDPDPAARLRGAGL